MEEVTPSECIALRQYEIRSQYKAVDLDGVCHGFPAKVLRISSFTNPYLPDRLQLPSGLLETSKRV